MTETKTAAPTITAADFDRDVLQSDVPVLVDFMAHWCGPCRVVGPEVNAIAAQFAGQAKVFTLDTDQEPELEARYGVRTIPTLLIFKGGEVVDTLHGAIPRRTLAEKLQAHL